MKDLQLFVKQSVIKGYKASGCTVYLQVNYLLVNTILRITLHLQMLYRQLLGQQAALPTILSSGAKSPFNKGLCPVGAIT